MAGPVIPPPPPGFTLDSVPPPPPGFSIDGAPKAEAPRPLGFPAGEAITNIGSSMAAAPIAGLAGIAGAVLPGPQGQGANWAGSALQALTYEPRTSAGRRIASAVSYPFEKLGELSDKAGAKVTDLTGSPLAGTVANVALNAAPMFLSRGAKPFAERAKAGAMSEVSRQADKSSTLIAGQQEGYVTMPESTLGKAATSIGGKDAVKHLAIEKNQDVTNKLARRAAGLGPDDAISSDNLAAARDVLAEPYRKVEALPGLPAPRTTSNINPMRNPYPLIGSTPKTPAELVHDWKSTNTEAMELWRDYQRNAKVETLDAYREKLKAKEVIEDNIEKAAIQAGQPQLVGELRAARVALAKNYDVEKALVLGSGDVDPRVIASEYKKRRGKGMTGELEIIAKMTNAYQTVMRASPKISPSGGTHGSAIESGLLALHGNMALATGLPMLRGASRLVALSRFGQPEPLVQPGLGVRLSDMATQNPYAFGVVPALGLRPEENNFGR